MTDEGEVDVDFELHAAEDIAATILTATGEPAGLAKIALGVRTAATARVVERRDCWPKAIFIRRVRPG